MAAFMDVEIQRGKNKIHTLRMCNVDLYEIMEFYSVNKGITLSDIFEEGLKLYLKEKVFKEEKSSPKCEESTVEKEQIKKTQPEEIQNKALSSSEIFQKVRGLINDHSKTELLSENLIGGSTLDRLAKVGGRDPRFSLAIIEKILKFYGYAFSIVRVEKVHRKKHGFGIGKGSRDRIDGEGKKYIEETSKPHQCFCGCHKNVPPKEHKGRGIFYPKYIYGHRPVKPLCACGCGKYVIMWNYKYERWYTYLPYHKKRQEAKLRIADKIKESPEYVNNLVSEIEGKNIEETKKEVDQWNNVQPSPTMLS